MNEKGKQVKNEQSERGELPTDDRLRAEKAHFFRTPHDQHLYLYSIVYIKKARITNRFDY